MQKIRILVTGASGFIGRQTLQRCVATGHEVFAVSRTAPAELGGAIWKTTDLLRSVDRRRLIETVQPTHLLHLAWITKHGEFWTALENVDWLAATLDLARMFGESGGERLVCAGTCWERQVYPDMADESVLSERPSQLYGATKDACRTVLNELSHELGFSFAWGRVFFVYGEYENPARLVPSVVRSLLAGEEAPCTNGTQIRDFMHVRDLGEAFARLLLAQSKGCFDLGTGTGVRIADLVDLLGVLIDRRHLIKLGALPNRRGEPPQIVADPTRLHKELGFRPQYDLPRGLSEVIAWWRNGMQ